MSANSNTNTIDTITLGAGCFWCVEAIYQNLVGVVDVESGYSGGTIKNPAYREVCEGRTGHAEVCNIKFNPDEISARELLEVFFSVHDPTTLNRQGNDVGTQYRSAIFFHSEEQQKIAQELLSELDNNGTFNDPIVTEITAFTNFYPAGDYHKDYFNLNGEQPYCSAVIKPKVDKFKSKFKHLLQ